MPTLADIAADPALARNLSPQSRGELIAACAAVLAALSAPMMQAEPAAEPVAQLRLHTVPEAAATLRLTNSHTYALIRTGQLRAVRQGRYVRVSADAIADYVRAHEGTRRLDPSLNSLHSRLYDGSTNQAGPENSRPRSGVPR